MAWFGTLVLMSAFVGSLTYLGFGSASFAVPQAVPVPQAMAMTSDLDIQAGTPVLMPEPWIDTVQTINPAKPIVLASIGTPETFVAETSPSLHGLPEMWDSTHLHGPTRVALDIPDDCLVADICVDRYLWAFYQRTPKQDTNKAYEHRKVTIKRRGKTVTVTRRFMKLVDADFTWKDPDAAQKVRMPLMTYVIGGMDRKFKRNLLYMLLTAEQLGFSPGITSGFRDDYRQEIASGQKAAANRSYHGGSLRGGYGRGMAADIVSVTGQTRMARWFHSGLLWKWVDEHGHVFDIGRPYLDKDAPHVAPTYGQEYASRRNSRATQQAQIEKKRKQSALKGNNRT